MRYFHKACFKISHVEPFTRKSHTTAAVHRIATTLTTDHDEILWVRLIYAHYLDYNVLGAEVIACGKAIASLCIIGNYDIQQTRPKDLVTLLYSDRAT